MIPLLTEVQAMQNPALGAVLVWRFACGYNPENTESNGVPMPLAFVVLPIVLHSRTRGEVETTHAASGVRKFEDKFKNQGDMLLAINQRAITMRLLSLRSMRIALAKGLLTLLPEQGTLWPRTYATPRGTAKPVASLMREAEKFGTWCARLSLFELSGILRVEF
jgi:hypothetical protein